MRKGIRRPNSTYSEHVMEVSQLMCLQEAIFSHVAGAGALEDVLNDLLSFTEIIPVGNPRHLGKKDTVWNTYEPDECYSTVV